MRFRHVVLLVIVAIAAFLLLMPTKVQPVAWTPPPAPSLTSGIYADNQRLKGVERVGAADIDGPEALLLCLLYTSPSPRDRQKSRMPSSA